MSSSTSSSDSAPWGRWLAAFLGALALGTALVFAFVIAVDPYDSGRFGILGIKGVSDGDPRTANASRSRDPDFDAAIIGNSTGQLLSPAELSPATGKRFVQLTVPGTGPREQLAIMRFFLRHHAQVGAMVIVTDTTWCARDADAPLQHPFPFWLYGESTLGYVARLFSMRALGRAMRRVALGISLRARSAPDGYWNYETLGAGDFNAPVAPPADAAPAQAGRADPVFPAIKKLDEIAKRMPDVPLVLVVPPVFSAALPQQGSAAALEQATCLAALKRVVAGRAHSNVIDYRVDNALTRDRANFVDVGHYRAKIARAMEKGIAASIRDGASAAIDF